MNIHGYCDSTVLMILQKWLQRFGRNAFRWHSLHSLRVWLTYLDNVVYMFKFEVVDTLYLENIQRFYMHSF